MITVLSLESLKLVIDEHRNPADLKKKLDEAFALVAEKYKAILGYDSF
ncbi:hypothetical protein A2U01_0071098 [Trifolium medium]|uniref:Uncharacterized protein n=1 Tax=Trifolium medium TaxID=97028 RepID=A0A392SNT9_9FABA|nr:hypothetical protein [Trifolium medium]